MYTCVCGILSTGSCSNFHAYIDFSFPHKLYRYNYQQHCYSDQYSSGHCHPSTVVAVIILPIIIINIIIIMKEKKSR